MRRRSFSPGLVALEDRLTPVATTLVSVTAVGMSSGNATSGDFSFVQELPQMSDDGRYFAFASGATDLLGGPGGKPTGQSFIYWRDTQTGVTKRASALAQSGAGFGPTISADGRFVSFETDGHYLWDSSTDALTKIDTPGGTRGGTSVVSPDGRYVAFRREDFQLAVARVHLFDRLTGKTAVISAPLTSAGPPVDDRNIPMLFSGDSKTLVFVSIAPANLLVPGFTDTNDDVDSFAYDIPTGKTTLLSVNAAGTGTGEFAATAQSVSGDGSRVTMVSFASDLDPTAPQNKIAGNVFVRDRTAGTTKMISTNPDRTVSNGARSAISRDGRFVMFQSGTGLLSSGATGVFRYEVATAKLEQVNVRPDGSFTQSGAVTTSAQVNNVVPRGISADGRFVTFVSNATDLVPGYTPTTRPDAETLNTFVRDMTTGVTILVSHTPGNLTQAGDNASSLPAISADGKVVAFNSTAIDLTAVADGNGRAGGDLFRSVLSFPPTATAGADVSVTVGTAIPPVAVTVADTETAADALTVTATADNPTLIPAAGIVVGGTGASRTVTITPAAGQTGMATVTVTVTDADGQTDTDTFTVTVPPANTPPTISDVANQTATSGQPVAAIPVTVGDAQTPAESLTVTAASSNTALLPVAAIVLGGGGANRTVQFTPIAGQTGTATITLTVADAGGLTATDTFTVTVNAAPVNTAPTISDVANQSTAAGKAVGPITVTVGDAETAADKLTVTAASSNTTLVPTAGVTVGGSGASRTVTVTPAAGQTGTATVTLTVTDGGGKTATDTFTVTVANTGPAPALVGFPQFAAGTDRGGDGSVIFYNPDKTVRFTTQPFGSFTGGVRTASADFTGDGIADVVAGTGPGRATRVVVLDGATKAELFAVDAFEASFSGGVYVAAGDLNGDGKADLVISPDEGGGPRVDIYSGAGFGKLASFFGIDDANFRGGARASTGDLNGDGRTDLVVVAGFGGGPRVAAFDGKSLGGTPTRVFGDFFAFEQSLRNGVFVTAGDIDGDGFAELIAGGGPGGGPRVTAFSGKGLMTNTQTVLANFFGGDDQSRGGVRLTVKNLDGDNRADIVVGAGAGAGGRVTAYPGKGIGPAGTPATAFDFDVVSGLTAGVFVG